MSNVLPYEMNEALIAAVFKRDPLWNPAHHLHRNVYVLTKLWREVAVDVQKDVKTIKARWKNLRAYFYKEQQKIDKSKEDGNHIGTTWQYYDLLQFLNGAVSERDPTLSLDDDDPMIYEINLKEEETDVPDVASDSDDSSHGSPPDNKTRKTEINDQLLEIEKKRLEILEREFVKEKSDDLLFFESLLPYMSNIPAVRKLRLRSKITDLILTEIEAVENNSKKEATPIVP